MVLALKRGNVVKLILCWIVFSDVEGQSFNQVTGALISCSPNPCLNGGGCITDPGNYTRSCRCPESHVGQFCQHVNPCYTGSRTTRRCLNGGRCNVEFPGNSFISRTTNPRFRCDCRIGFSASLCEIPLPNVCDRTPCQNGGTCNLLSLTNYTCNCREGYRGVVCDQVNYCASKPCKNAGSCRSLDNGFKCQCAAGFDGETCTEDINECATGNPCGNGGSCVNTVGSYHCRCLPGFTGQNCDQIYVPCNPSPCKNGGKCYNKPTEPYTDHCDCTAGFEGRYCETNVNDCVKNICTNGATCVDGINGYQCECPASFTGMYCQTDVDECAQIPQPCKNGATCQNTHGGYSCICVNGWQGQNCDYNVDDCSATVCLNGATCHDRVGSFSCECPPGKTGILCHLEDACFSKPCHGAALCDTSPIDGSYKCNCADPGFTGTNCDQDIDECSMAHLCEHGGQCRNTVGSFVCDCAKGYTGPRCEVNINECASNPCENDGTCLDLRGEYKCVCMPGYGGINCEIDINECRKSPCRNGGICTDLMNGFQCTCPIGYSGPTCEIEASGCYYNPCKNGGKCIDSGPERCKCPPGFGGRLCEENINDCANSPCRFGTCIDGADNFTCKCRSGYTGHLCEHPVNECATTKPCRNGGRCENGLGTYYCQCPPDFTGANCEKAQVAARNCYGGACRNGGTCMDSSENGHGYQCQCPAGFAGSRCEDYIDECRNNPCKNGGKCSMEAKMYRPGLFHCDCPEGFTGDICQTAKYNVQRDIPEPRRFVCPQPDCQAKAHNGKCDEECNNMDCDYDGQECSLRMNPWLNCTQKTHAPCWNYFRNGRCDQECNIVDCMFDGFECGVPLGRCDPKNDVYCSTNYGNGKCDDGCNTVECDYDGLDCDQDVPKPVEGVLIVIVRTTPEIFRNNTAPFLRGLGRALRSVASIKKDEAGKDQIMPWSLNGGIAINPEDATGGTTGTAVYISLDNRKCQSDCIPNADAAAAFLAAAQQRGELKLEYPLYSVQAQADRIVQAPSQNNLWFLVILGVLMVSMVGYGVVTVHNNRKRVRATTWFPEGFVKSTSTTILNEHMTLPKNSGDMKKSPAGVYENRQGMTDSSTVNSYYDSDSEPATKRRKDNREPRQWTQSHFDAAELKGGRGDVFALTPPSQSQDEGLGIDVNAKGPGGMTPLMLAAMRGTGLDADRDDLHGGEDDAAVNIIHELLMQGANIDAQSDKDGETALHMAARCARADAAKLLLENGADVNARDNSGRAPLHSAIAADSVSVFGLLKQHRKVDWSARMLDGTTPLILAARLCINDMLDELLKVDQLDINSADELKRTALHWAASVNNHIGCKQLLYKGAKVDVQDESAQTPLFLAAKEGNFEAARELLDHKASPELADDMDKLPRDIAVERMHKSIVRLLDEHKEVVPSPPQNLYKNFALGPSANTIGLATLARYTSKPGRKNLAHTMDSPKKLKRTPLDMSLGGTMGVHQNRAYDDSSLYSSPQIYYPPDINTDWQQGGAMNLKNPYYSSPHSHQTMKMGQSKFPINGQMINVQNNAFHMQGFNAYATPPSVHSSSTTPSPAMAKELQNASNPNSPGNWSGSPASASSSSEWSEGNGNGMHSPRSAMLARLHSNSSSQKLISSSSSNPNQMYQYITANSHSLHSQDPRPMYL